MRILYVNWAPVWHGADVGGGVNLYLQSIATAFSEKGHRVFTVSSGYAHDWKRKAVVRKAAPYCGVENFEIVNSPIMAPAIFNFMFPDRETDCPPVERCFEEILAGLRPDVVHFQNIEGFSSTCIDIAARSGARVFYSLHNYHSVCSQVGLLFRGETVCEDFRQGRRCLECVIPLPRGIELRKRQLKTVFDLFVFGGDRLWGRLMLAMVAGMHTARKCKARLFPGAHPIQSLALKNDRRDGIGYALRRKRMIEAINRTDGVLAVSRFVKDLFVGMGLDPDLVTVNHIGNKMADRPLPEPGASGPARLPVKMVFLGVADPLKGLPFLLKTLCSMPAGLLGSLELHVHARGITRLKGLDSELSAQIRMLDKHLSSLYIADGYRFDELPSILAGKDLGIVPPIWYDNAPQVVFEMLSLGVPVIGARIGGIPDFVRHGENGMLFDPGSVDDLGRTLKTVVTDPGVIDRFRQGIKPMKTVAAHIDDLEALYGLG
jgi:glycosyltransferase involved in cell wall biosynthesis